MVFARVTKARAKVNDFFRWGLNGLHERLGDYCSKDIIFVFREKYDGVKVDRDNAAEDVGDLEKNAIHYKGLNRTLEARVKNLESDNSLLKSANVKLQRLSIDLREANRTYQEKYVDMVSGAMVSSLVVGGDRDRKIRGISSELADILRYKRTVVPDVVGSHWGELIIAGKESLDVYLHPDVQYNPEKRVKLILNPSRGRKVNAEVVSINPGKRLPGEEWPLLYEIQLDIVPMLKSALSYFFKSKRLGDSVRDGAPASKET